MSTEPARDPEAGKGGSRPVWVTVLKAGVLLLLLAAAVWYLISHELPTVEQIRGFVEGFGAWGPLVFAVVFMLVAATPVPVTIMAVSGGFLFGMAQGSVVGVVATTAGAWLGYWLARFLGRDALYRLAGPRMGTVERKLDGKGFLTVLVLRPVLPNWTLSYGSGLVRIPQRDYLAATLLGGMPGQISFAALGAFTSRPSWPALAAVAASWALVVVVGVFSWRRSRHDAQPGGTAEPGDAADQAGAGGPA
ncbi:TVP38/TMEM64 family protein [Kocuria turfanensis]|uniref:TVP38/TMEM64 family protein n=1 Tax=Kocuria turfanensis TaxID=388357 RepID=UPI0011BDE021|nr:TVP38/TMEM64 family protein [Kocuria turfanensis]